MPSALHKTRNLKFEPVLKPANFLGYVMQDGGTWFGEYLWAFLEDLAEKPFWSKARWSECRGTIHSGRELRFDSKQPVEFPCASLYRRDNATAEGLQKCIEEQAQAQELEDEPLDGEATPRADSLDAPLSDAGRDVEGAPEGEPSDGLPPEREEFPTAVYEELGDLKREISTFRQQLDFINTVRPQRGWQAH